MHVVVELVGTIDGFTNMKSVHVLPVRSIHLHVREPFNSGNNCRRPGIAVARGRARSSVTPISSIVANNCHAYQRRYSPQ
jgi:hypothetical protein